MNTKLVEFELENGDSVVVEVKQEEDGMELVALDKDGVLSTNIKFADAMKRIKPAAEAVLQAFKGMETPEKINLEFGLKFSAKAGVIISSIDSEATFKVALEWGKNKQTKK